MGISFHPALPAEFTGKVYVAAPLDSLPELLDQRRHDAALLGEQCRQQVPRLHLIVRTAAGLILPLLDRRARHDRQLVGIHMDEPRMPRANSPRRVTVAAVCQPSDRLALAGTPRRSRGTVQSASLIDS